MPARQPPTPPTETFEYMNVYMTDDFDDNLFTLNKRGKEGWRVIHVARTYYLLERKVTA
jgi:hypothetical protein